MCCVFGHCCLAASGIIIDTFGQLREELQSYENDLNNFCFICAFNSEVIEKNSENNRGFKTHIKVSSHAPAKRSRHFTTTQTHSPLLEPPQQKGLQDNLTCSLPPWPVPCESLRDCARGEIHARCLLAHERRLLAAVSYKLCSQLTSMIALACDGCSCLLTALCESRPRRIKQNDHYMWNYLFYIAYLLEKDVTEYTGIESYVADKIDKGEISWFPIYK